MPRARRARNRSLLEDEIVGLAFYEASTRTRVSFEVAAKALGATTVDLAIATSSVEKGESLVDTARTLERTGVTILVLRHPSEGAAELAARTTGLRVVNGGDGIHAHPTQALADALTLREALGPLDGRRIVIVGRRIALAGRTLEHRVPDHARRPRTSRRAAGMGRGLRVRGRGSRWHRRSPPHSTGPMP